MFHIASHAGVLPSDRRTAHDDADDLGAMAGRRLAGVCAGLSGTRGGHSGAWPAGPLAHDVHDPDGRFAVSVWDALEAMQASEQRAVFRQKMPPILQPFWVGENTTSRCDVKYVQSGRRRALTQQHARPSWLSAGPWDARPRSRADQRVCMLGTRCVPPRRVGCGQC